MIEQHGHELFLKYAPKGGSVLELGDQIMNLEFVQNISAKDYYTSLGYKHTSVDINGKHGSLAIDLNYPSKSIGQFDIVTDFGTGEHLSNLYQFLSNAFMYCSTDGIMIHKNPKTGSFPFHCYHYFTMQFWVEYARLCNLDIIELYEHAIYGNTTDGWEVIVVLRKKVDSCPLLHSEWESIEYLIKSE